MLYCENCRKEVIIYGVSHSEENESNLKEFTKKIESEGKLILFNPPPFEDYNCPVCFKKLDQKEN